MTEDEKKLERLRQQLSHARPYEKQGIAHQIQLQEHLIEHKKTLGDRIVAHATDKAANVQVQAILDSAAQLLESMNGAAQLMCSEARQLSLAIKEADKSSYLVGRALVIIGSAAWFSLAWNIAEKVTSDGYGRAVVMGGTAIFLAVVLIWSGVFKGLFGRQKVCKERDNESLPDHNP